MKLRVLFFSVLRDLTGTAELELTTGATTVQELLAVLFERWPALVPWEASLLIAIDQAYARRGDPLHDGAEIAIMPPVQGG